MNYTLKITALPNDNTKLVNLTAIPETELERLEHFIFALNGSGANTKSTTNAMLDMDCIRTGSLPFTRNGFRFERAD